MDETVTYTTAIETPVGNLPDLTELGISEVDAGMCYDTFENRRILRENKLLYQPVYGPDGAKTDFIQAYTVQPDQEHELSMRTALLSDTRDKNSDYINGLNLILDDDAVKAVPSWVIPATRKFLAVERQRADTGKHYTPSLLSPPGRCVVVKSNGVRCLNWHNGTANCNMKCKIHLGVQDEKLVNTREKARSRMDSLASAAVDELEKLLTSATSEPVRLKATEIILDRVGIRAGIEIDSKVDVEVHAASTVLEQRLARLAISERNRSVGDEDIIEAETVETETPNEQ